MMPDIDPLILRLEVEAERAKQELRDYATAAERRFQQMEDRMRRSTDEIGASFRTLAGTLAAAFSVQQVQQLADGYTRFTNSLKVTGLEGERLAQTQEKLFGIAQEYGVELESVGSLFSRAAQSQDALGASSADLLAVTEAVSASLKILPAEAGAVSGALTQLGQALASPRVEAEEFGSLMDVLTPLLQEAAKHIEGTGGTLAGLKQKLKDTKGPGLSNVELFRAISASLAELQKKAGEADQTIGAALTKLNNSLGRFVGETDDAYSATERIAQAIEKLANNLDTIIPILATIIGFIGVKYVAALATAIARSAGLAAVSLGLAASLNGVGAAAALTGTRLLALAGGPLAAVVALAAGLAYIASEMDDGSTASGQYATQLGQLKKAQDAATDAAEKLATATGQARREAIANAKALRQETIQYLENAKAALIAARAKAQEAAIQKQKALNESDPRSSTGAAQALAAGGGQFGIPVNPGTMISTRVNNQAQTDLKAARAAVKGYEDVIADLNRTINGTPQVVVPASDDKKKGSGGSGRSGPSADDINRRFQDELATAQAELEQTNAENRNISSELAAAMQTRIRTEQAINERAIKADKDYSEEQKQQLLVLNDQIAAARVQAVNRQEQAQLEQDAADLADARFRNEVDALRNQYDLAQTEDDRRIIALRILAAEDEYLRQKLEAVRLSKVAGQAEKDRAKLDLDALNATAGDRRRVVEKANAGALERYIEEAGDTKARVEEAMVRQIRDINDGITDALTEQLGIKNQFIKDLFSIFLDQVIFRPLAEALQSAQGGGGGGFFSSLISGISAAFGVPGRASGGYVAPGQMVRVNEHRGGAEYLRMGSQGGTVIPLGQVNQRAMSASQQGGGTVRLVIEEAPGFAARVRAEAQGVAIDVQRQAAPGLINASANETMKRTAKAQRYGR